MQSTLGDLSVFSFSHVNTTLEQRDKLAFSSAEIAAFLPVVREAIGGEFAVLSTCNRTELYCYNVPGLDLWPALKPLLCAARQITPSACPQPAIYRSSQAAIHLMRVACSLESLALGENQIMAQVRDAHELLLQDAQPSPVLDKLFQLALRTGKLVRTETALCDGAVSISSASVDLARKIFGQFAPYQILLVGAGETAIQAGVHFYNNGAKRFVVANRGAEAGESTAARFGGKYTPLDQLFEALREADIAVFATGAQQHLLKRDDLKRLMRARGTRPLLLIDISNPRNVDPDCAKQDGVFLYNIDNLKQVVEANLQGRVQEIPRAEAIIARQLDEWQAWVQSMRVMPTIASLSRYFDQVRQQELTRHQRQLDERERALLDAYSRGLVKKLLHYPIMYLRQAVAQNTLRSEDLNLVLALYNLQDPAPAPQGNTDE